MIENQQNCLFLKQKPVHINLAIILTQTIMFQIILHQFSQAFLRVWNQLKTNLKDLNCHVNALDSVLNSIWV